MPVTVAPTTIPQALALRAEIAGDRLALIDAAGRRLTYAGWLDRAARAAAALTRLGVRPGDRVALTIHDRDFLDYAVAYVAVQLVGGCSVVISARLTGREVLQAMQAADTAGCIRSVDRSDLTGTAAPWWITPRDLESSEALDDDRSTAYGLAQILYTSGSTGDPRGVAATHANLVKGISRRLVLDLDVLQRPETFVHCLPIGTNAAQSMLLTCLSEAEITVVLDGFDPQRFCDVVAAHEATGTLLVPAMAHALLQWDGPAAEQLRSLRNLGLTGAPTPPATLRRLAELCPNADISNFYTTTEAWPSGTAMVYDPARPDALGRVSGRDDIRVVGSISAAAPGEVGMVQLRVDADAPRAYLDEVEALHQPSGSTAWISTGDLGWVDAEGWLRLVDREKRLINTGGFKVSPREVEAVLSEHPRVDDVAVFGAPHAVLGSLIVAAVVTQGEDSSEADILSFAEERLAAFKVPQRLLFVDSLPLLVSGKVDVGALADRYERSRPSYEPPVNAEEKVVCDAWQRTLGLSHVGRHDDFFEVGGHSIAAAQVTALVNERLGCALPISAVYALRTPAALATEVVDSRPSPAGARAGVARAERASAPLSRNQVRYTQPRSDGTLPTAIALSLVRAPLDRARLEEAVQQICEAHPMLRTRFQLDARSQHRTDEPMLALEWKPLPEIAGPADPGLRSLLIAEALRGHDVESGPTGKMTTHLLGDSSTVLVWSLAHLVADGWALGILQRDLAAAYNGEKAAANPGADFFDVVLAEEAELASPAGRGLGKDLARRLATPPRLPRFPGGTADIDSPVASIPARLTLGDEAPEIRAAARSAGATPFMLIVAGYAAALAAWSDDTVALFTNVLGRDSVDLQSLVAPLNRSAILRIDVPRGGSSLDMVHSVRSAIIDVQAHPFPAPIDVPGIDIAAYRRMSLGSLPDSGAPPRFDGIPVEPFLEAPGHAQTIQPGGYPGMALAVGVSGTPEEHYIVDLVADAHLLPEPARLAASVGIAVRWLCRQPRQPLRDLLTALRDRWQG